MRADVPEIIRAVSEQSGHESDGLVMQVGSGVAPGKTTRHLPLFVKDAQRIQVANRVRRRAVYRHAMRSP